MHAPTTARAAILRRAGTLAVAAALVGAPATTAIADPTPGASAASTASATATATARPTASAGPEPSATATDPTPSSNPSPSTPASPSSTPTASPSPTAAAAQPAKQARLAGGAATLLGASGTAAPTTAFAADFVARTLAAGGDHYVYPDSGGYVDGGNTIDAILALDGAGAGAAQSDASLGFLQDNVREYIGTTYSSTYAGPTAKALLAVVAHGADPADVDGLDLIEELRASEDAVEPGRFSDLPVDCGYPTCDYSNTIGQSLAVIALLRAGESVSTASIDLLLAQQCADGGFRGEIGGEACTSDPDATAFAAQALIAAGAAAEADEALAWLADVQLTGGALESSDGEANANTTGLAAQAFAAGGYTDELAAAQAFLVTLQYGCTSPPALRGGIAFSAATRSTGAPTDSDLRASPQATLGLSGESLLSVTAEGAAAGTTATPCTATPTPSQTTTTPAATPATTTSGTAAPVEDVGSSGSGPQASGDDAVSAAQPSGSLAQTGADLLWPVGLGLVLVAIGALAVLGSRRRGAHA